MKKKTRKLQLQKRTIANLRNEEKQQVNGGASVTCYTIRICPTPPESLNCPTTF